MRRIRWFDAESDDPSAPVAWPLAALVLSTLFLNIWFCEFYVAGFGPRCPLPLYVIFQGAFALIVTALFFMGPALAAQAAGRPLFGVVENALGSIPALGLRLICVLYLVLWIAGLVAVPVRVSSPILGRDVSPTEAGLFAAALLVFLFATGLQSLRNGAKLALFTNKLAIAILVAALIRVHEGWPDALDIFTAPGGRPWFWAWRRLSLLAAYVAPLALLAADFGHRCRERRQEAMTGLMGIGLPLFGTLVVVGVINAVTLASPLYQPSLSPSILLALWSQTARSAQPARMMVAAITLFGAVRFGAMALARTASIRVPGPRRGLVLLGCFIGAIAWSSLHPYSPAFTAAFDWSARCLALAGAVVTVDYVTGRRRIEQARRVDWIGLIALLAGLATPLFVPHGPVDLAWLLPSYLVGFFVCLCGRAAQKLYRLPQAGARLA